MYSIHFMCMYAFLDNAIVRETSKRAQASVRTPILYCSLIIYITKNGKNIYMRGDQIKTHRKTKQGKNKEKKA